MATQNAKDPSTSINVADGLDSSSHALYSRNRRRRQPSVAPLFAGGLTSLYKQRIERIAEALQRHINLKMSGSSRDSGRDIVQAQNSSVGIRPTSVLGRSKDRR